MSPYASQDDDLLDDSPPPEPQQLEPGTVEHDAFARFAQLTMEYREARDRADAMKRELDILGYQLRDYLTARGWRGLDVGNHHVGLKRDIFVRMQDWATQEIVCAALKKHGLGHFVREQYATSSMTSHIRSLEQEHAEDLRSGRLQSVGELLPAEVAAALNFEPTYQLVATRRRGKGTVEPASENPSLARYARRKRS